MNRNRLLYFVCCMLYAGLTMGTNCNSWTFRAAPPGYSTSSTATPPPSQSTIKPQVGTYFIQDVTEYFPDPSCHDIGRDTLGNMTSNLSKDLALSGWGSKGVYDTSSSKTEHWVEPTSYYCKAFPDTCHPDSDLNGVDSANLVVFAGHGYRPDSVGGPGSNLSPGKTPHQSLIMGTSSTIKFINVSGQISQFELCGPRLSNGPTSCAMTPSGEVCNWSMTQHDTMIGSFGEASHLALLSSCTAQPRMIDNYFNQGNRTSQLFGFMYSPADTVLNNEMLGQFYRDSEIVGNSRAWTNTFGLVNESTVRSQPAAAVAYTLVDGKDNQDIARAFAFEASAQSGISTNVQSLKKGQHLTRKLTPQSTAQASSTIGLSAKAYMEAIDVCKAAQRSTCGNPDPSSTGCGNTGSNGQPLLSDQMRVFGQTGAATMANSAGTPAVGTNLPVITVTAKPVDEAAIAKGLADIAYAITQKQFDVQYFKDGVHDNIQNGRWDYHFAGEGIVYGYDPKKQKSRIMNLYTPDTFVNGTPVTITPTQAASIVEEWMLSLPLAGLPNYKFFSFQRPHVSELTEKAIGFNEPSRLLAYTYAIRREINGAPVADQVMNIWIHRSGAIMYVEILGSGANNPPVADLAGEPGHEYSIVGRTTPVSVSIKSATDTVRAWADTNHAGAEPNISAPWLGYINTSPNNLRKVYRPVYFFSLLPTTNMVAGRSIVVTVPVTAPDVGAPNGGVSVTQL